MKVEFIATTISIHLVLLLALYGETPKKPEVVEFTVQTSPPAPQKNVGNLILPPGKDKKVGEDVGDKPVQEADSELILKTYAEKVKATVDPVWYKNIKPYLSNVSRLKMELQVSLNEKGEIKNIILLTSCGIRVIDNIGVKTFNDVGRLPTPPKELNPREIIWTFSID